VSSSARDGCVASARAFERNEKIKNIDEYVLRAIVSNCLRCEERVGTEQEEQNAAGSADKAFVHFGRQVSATDDGESRARGVGEDTTERDA